MSTPTASSTSTPAPAMGAAPVSGRRIARRLGACALAAVAATACYNLETTSPRGATLNFKSNPCRSPDTVQLSVAQTQRIDCSNGGTTVTFAAAGASYLIVPEFATDQAPFQFIEYAVDSGTATPATAFSTAAAHAHRLAAAAAAGLLPAVQHTAAQRLADARLRQRGRALAPAIRAARARSAPAAVRAVRAAVPAQGSVRAFQVFSNFFGTTDTWATVNASLQYAGNNILLYVDTLAPAGGFTPAQLQTYGQYFDQTLFPIDTTAFGAPTDIDGNGRVIVLMSGVVNGATPTATCNSSGFVAGFFNPEDYAPTASDPNSNQGEIFYTILPDSSGQYSCAHTLGDLEYVVPPTFLHELQHLIDFGQHVVVAGGSPLSSWLDEGLSIAAEELGSLHYELQCPGTACRTNPTQLFPDSSQPFIQGFFYDSYEFALLPDTASILLENDADGGFSWRGGAWLLVRWMADQKGNGILRQLEQGPDHGVAAIAQVMGEPFPQAFADFGLALYTDSLPGLPRGTAPAADRFVTRNLRQMWGRLYATSGGTADIPLAMPVQLYPVTADTTAYGIYPGTVTYLRLDTPSKAGTVSVQFA
ncbi:MAG TPA: hypothetical protein VMT21_03710, partial [Gemmatimonadales bacterium]|nr:hypothetical protein [Gemmatimonadales bacterium]